VALLVTSTGAQAALDEIIVTAQKRAENIQNVPLSVTALTGEKIDILSSGGSDIRFLRARVPSLYIESSFGRTFPRFYIRGLGNTDFDLNASQPVSLVYDGVVLESPILKGFPVFDLDRIEVLRGPQGTLFGRNTPAGLVKFDSKKPSQDASGYGKISYGRFNSVSAEAAYGGPVSQVVSVRISMMFQHRNDYIDNTFTGQNDALGGYDEFAGRGQILYEPNSNFSALLNVHGRRLSGTARVFRGNLFTPGTNHIRPGFRRDKVSQDGPNSQDLNEIGGLLHLEYDTGSVTLTSITGYENAQIFTKGDIDGGFGDVFGGVFPTGPGLIPFATTTQDNIPHLAQVTQEVRLATNQWGRLDFQLGAFFFNEKLNAETLDFGANNPTPVAIGVQSQQTNAWAIFASADFDITDQFKLTGGVRYSSDNKDFSASRPFDMRPGFLGFGGVFTPASVSPDDQVVSWDVSATYEVNDDVSVYGRIAKGFRAPSIQGRIAFFPVPAATSPNDAISVARTETVLSFEGGIKSLLFEGRARINASGFYYTINNQQLTAVGGVGNFNRLLNADSTQGYGFELDAEFQPTDNLLITTGASFNHTEIQDPTLTVQPCGAPLTPCTVLDPLDGSGNAFIDGNSLPQAPRWIANVTARYSIPYGANGEFFVYTDWAYRSNVNFFLYDSAEFHDEFMLEGGVRIGYSAHEGAYELAAFGRNITNDTSAVGGIDFNNLTGFVNEPPFWGIEVISRF